jgi:hypothetical protein
MLSGSRCSRPLRSGGRDEQPQQRQGAHTRPLVPLLLSTLDTPAWLKRSHGAQCLYVVKRESSMGGNRAYLSTRDASRKLKAGRQKIREWYAELAHYGFIVMLSAGCLGSDGYGKAPNWRLTEKGNTSKHNPEGLFEPPTNDFVKWDGKAVRPEATSRQAHQVEEKTESRYGRPCHIRRRRWYGRPCHI